MSLLGKLKGLVSSKSKPEEKKPEAPKPAAKQAEQPTPAAPKAAEKPVAAKPPKAAVKEVTYSEERLAQIVQMPHVSEKSVQQAQNQQHTFVVLRDATRGEVKAAVELMFEVEVEEVRMANVRGKQVRNGTRSNWRKAMVRLAPGQNLDTGEVGA